MEPKTRNRGLMIGGGIILVLLLLVCGPLEGKFGTNTEQKTPDVAAGPPPAGNLGAAAGVAAAGAAAGAAIGESDIAGVIEGRDAAAGEFDGAFGEGVDSGREATADGLAAAGGVVSGAGAAMGAGASAAGAAIVSATTGSGSAAGASAGLGASAGAGAAGASAARAARSTRGSLPSVSAGVPIESLPSIAAASSGPSAAELAAEAANAFDVAAAGIVTSGIGVAGKVVDRFAPPVESGPVNSPLRLTQADAFGAGVLRPCDSPGAGCQNVSAIVGSGGGSVNPPIGSLGPPGPGNQGPQ